MMTKIENVVSVLLIKEQYHLHKSHYSEWLSSVGISSHWAHHLCHLHHIGLKLRMECLYQGCYAESHLVILAINL